MYLNYHRSYASLKASLALAVEPLSGSGKPDQIAVQFVETTR